MFGPHYLRSGRLDPRSNDCENFCRNLKKPGNSEKKRKIPEKWPKFPPNIGLFSTLFWLFGHFSGFFRFFSEFPGIFRFLQKFPQSFDLGSICRHAPSWRCCRTVSPSLLKQAPGSLKSPVGPIGPLLSFNYLLLSNRFLVFIQCYLDTS